MHVIRRKAERGVHPEMLFPFPLEFLFQGEGEEKEKKWITRYNQTRVGGMKVECRASGPRGRVSEGTREK